MLRLHGRSKQFSVYGKNPWKGREVKSKVVAESKNVGMSTLMTHRVFGRHAEESLKAVRFEAARLEKMLSRFIQESEISMLNRSAGIKLEKLSPDTFKVLRRATALSKYCKGAFDVTVGPLAALWSSCRGKRKPPKDSEIMKALHLVDYTLLFLDPCKMTAGLQKQGQSIDLGGIGKGYAGDRFLEVFRKYGISSALTNIGGNVVALGTKPDGLPWRVGIQHPRKKNSLIGLVSVADKAVVTSGDYQRYFIGSNGKRFHHILDPFTGYPADSGLASATVIADNSMDADALSTILFIAGRKKGKDLLRFFPGTQAILIDTDLKVYITKALKNCFQIREGIIMEILDN
ncbi:MAG: FAD:protein FMN transferase [Candidatus Humimicrobiaceae bacterium]